MRVGVSAVGVATTLEKACNVDVGIFEVGAQGGDDGFILEVALVSSGLRVALAAEVAPVNFLEVGCGTDKAAVGCFELFVVRLQAFVFSSLGGTINVCLCRLCSCRG